MKDQFLNDKLLEMNNNNKFQKIKSLTQFLLNLKDLKNQSKTPIKL